MSTRFGFAFKSCILKLTARCNLDCTYCYIFNLEDKTFTRVPPRLSEEDALLVLARIEEHASKQNLGAFRIVLHGGEPTLWPFSFFESFVEGVGAVRSWGLDLTVSLQTNAYQLRPELLLLLKEAKIQLGVSLDGPQVFNDSRRVTRAGRGSYDRVVRNLATVIDAGMLGGLLCVADPDIAPGDFLEWIDGLGVRCLDLLWPMEYNYQNLPWANTDLAEYRSSPRYGEWFGSLFELWWARDDPSFVIRLFSESVSVMLGSKRHTDMLVNDVVDMMVINTDGGIEHHDFLRPIRDGGTRTRYNIREHSLNEVSEDPVFQFMHTLGSHLPSESSRCGVVGLCGGGYLPGRLDANLNLPQRRSVLCLDQYRFFRQVDEAVRPYLSPEHSRAAPLDDHPPRADLFEHAETPGPVHGVFARAVDS